MSDTQTQDGTQVVENTNKGVSADVVVDAIKSVTGDKVPTTVAQIASTIRQGQEAIASIPGFSAEQIRAVADRLAAVEQRQIEIERQAQIQARQEAILNACNLAVDEENNTLLYDEERRKFLFDTNGNPDEILASAQLAAELVNRVQAKSLKDYEAKFASAGIMRMPPQKPISVEEWNTQFEEAKKKGDAGSVLALLEKRPGQ